MKLMNKYFFIALVLLIVAALLRFWIAPLQERLPANYANEARLIEENNFRDSPTGEWQTSTLRVQRVDQAMKNTGTTAIIEGALHVYFESGEMNFETSGLYGIDRRTRLNLAGYGDVNRTGQYLFPPHVRRIAYPIWDPMFIELRQASYQGVEQVEGLRVYVFTFSASGMDESAGYAYLPDVPERFLAHTDGEGTIWVEPLSGIVVDYEDRGVSYFIDPSTGERLADFNQWEEHYTAETRANQVEQARAFRLRILLFETWFPAICLVGSLVFVTIGFTRQEPNQSKGEGTTNGL
jgi:hypothetical protein